jgi:hypothetical protein
MSTPPPPPTGSSPPSLPGVYVRQQRTNGFGVASLVLGILWIFWIGSILALVFGLIAKRQIDESGGGQSGLVVFGDVNFSASS